MMCGLLRPTAGTARVAGFDLYRAASSARARLGYMAQKFSLYGDLSVRQNLDFFAGVYGLPRDRRRTMTGRMVESFGLQALSRRQRRLAAAGLQAAARPGLRGHARAGSAVPRRADLRRRPADPARVLVAHQRHGRAGRHRDGHDPLPRRGRVLRPRRAWSTGAASSPRARPTS